MIQHRKELEAYLRDTGDLRLPKDYTTDIERAGALWLLKGGVSTSIALHYRLGWSEAQGRVVLPVWVDNELVYVQSRAVFPNHKPKYVNKRSVGKGTTMFKSDDALLLHEPPPDTCVLVEDILSTIRVGRLCPTRASLGTSLSDATAAALLSEFSTVLIWYDDDEAGVRGAVKAKKTLQLQGGNVRTIKTDKDPKEYNNEEIRRILTVDP